MGTDLEDRGYPPSKSPPLRVYHRFVYEGVLSPDCQSLALGKGPNRRATVVSSLWVVRTRSSCSPAQWEANTGRLRRSATDLWGQQQRMGKDVDNATGRQGQ